MADPRGEKELEYHTDDTQAAAYTTNNVEPVSTEPLEGGTYGKDLNSEKQVDSSASKYKDGGRTQQLSRFNSSATESSSNDVDAKSTDQAREKKKWYKNLNPLKWRTPPPVPSERIISREYNASFPSKVYFQWMSPIMSVSGVVCSDDSEKC